MLAIHQTLLICLLAVLSLDDIILDIYRAATELGETDYEQLQTDLYALHESPINLNATSDEELSQLYFLTPRQIDDILAYADRHPFASLYELQLIPSLADYEIRDLLPFVTVTNDQSPSINDRLYAREVLHGAGHEVVARTDVRNAERFEGTDPVYTQLRYRFDYRRRVLFGLQLRRPSGGMADDLQYGGFVQLRDISPHVHTVVAGTYQASFGQGLVMAPVFRNGKSAYVSTVGQATEGLRYYSSVDGEGLTGAGATIRHAWSRQTRLDASLLYSAKRTNDTTWHHLIGANLTLRHKRLQVALTAIENIWTDSIRPYRNAAYNRHYFRGRNQAVIGASARYNHGWFDLFGEVATAQNYGNWGVATIVGSRFYPVDGLSLIALYRYYSPWFDNALGYAFSETGRIGDENGGYIGFELTRLRRWRLSGYADVFRFSGPKYGIPDYPSWGYDALLEAQYHSPAPSPYFITLRARAREKGSVGTYSLRALFDWQQGGWSLRSTAEANLVNHPSSVTTNPSSVTYGYTVYQDVAYNFSFLNNKVPLSLRFRAQWFDAREWDNRVYCYEHDVLYAYSSAAVYGVGGRAYMCLRWQIIRRLALYLRLSETVWQRAWYAAHHPEWPSGSSVLPTRTDVHLLLRASL